MNADNLVTDYVAYQQLLCSTAFTLLLRMQQDLNRPGTSPGMVIRYAHAFARLAKLENDKRRIDASIEIAKIKARATVDAATVRSTPQEDRYEYTPEAPWGRKKDGTPYTHEEFKVYLRRACYDIWGLNLPENYGEHPSDTDPTDESALYDDNDDDDRAADDPAPDDDDDADRRDHDDDNVGGAGPDPRGKPAPSDDKLRTQHSKLSTSPPPKPVQTFCRNPDAFIVKNNNPWADF